MFTVASFLDHLSLGDSLEIKKLQRILKLTKKADKEKLDIALNALTKIGLLEKDSDGFIKKSSDDSFLEARLRCSSKGYCFAIRDDGGEDIYIRDHHLNHAWNGDRVLVRVLKEAIRRKSPEGLVECILERNSRNILCLLENDNETLVANPLDDRIIGSIELDYSNIKFIVADKQNLAEVRIDKFPIAQYDAQGHVIRSLSLDSGDEGDIDILLSKFNLNQLSPIPRISLKAPLEKNRTDFTDQETLLLNSWTSHESPPLPAVSVEARDGGYRLWVHAPSIAERLSVGNNLDLWIKDNAETHCLGNNWHSILTDKILKESRFTVGEVNHAISIVIDISSKGVVTDWNFSLSIIKPVALITKEHLAALEARKPKSRTIPTCLKPIKDYLPKLQTLLSCASLLHCVDVEKGLIELDISVFSDQDNSDLAQIYPSAYYDQWHPPYNVSDPNSVLSKLIRVANCCWYNHCSSLNLPLIHTSSEQVDSSTINDLAKSALSLGIELKLDTDGEVTTSDLSFAFSKSKSRRILDKSLRHAIPTPKLAIYYPIKTIEEERISPESQPILYSDKLAPWCSPGSHYYEIMNQYVQVTLLRDAKNKATARTKDVVLLGQKDCFKNISWDILSPAQSSLLQKIFNDKNLNHLNSQHIKAKQLLNGIINMKQARKVEPLIGQELDAVITGVQSYGFFAEISPSLAEGLVHVSTLNDDWYEYRSRQNRLIGRKSKQVYELGDTIKVRIIKVDILRNQIDLELSNSNTVSESASTDSDNNILIESLDSISDTLE